MDLIRSERRLIVIRGFLAGLILGVIARAWMRWISTDPEFSWTGTIYIVLAFVIFWTAHSFVHFAREGAWSRRKFNIIRTIAVILSLPLFGAAGSAMLPTVLTASLAKWRTDWSMWLRILLGIASVIIPINLIRGFGHDFGWGIATVGRTLLFILIYAAAIAATRATVTPLAKN